MAARGIKSEFRILRQEKGNKTSFTAFYKGQHVATLNLFLREDKTAGAGVSSEPEARASSKEFLRISMPKGFDRRSAAEALAVSAVRYAKKRGITILGTSGTSAASKRFIGRMVAEGMLRRDRDFLNVRIRRIPTSVTRKKQKIKQARLKKSPVRRFLHQLPKRFFRRAA